MLPLHQTVVMVGEHLHVCVCVQFAEAAKTVTNRPVVNLTSDNTADPVIQDLRKQLSEMNDRNQSLQVLQQLFPSRTLQLVQLVELYGVVVVGTPCGLGGVVEYPPRFVAECCKRQLNQGSFVLLYFGLFTFSDLY